MNNILASRHNPIHSLLPDVADLFAAFPAIGALRANSHLIRVEDELGENEYLVRAELPGIDPTKDVEIIVRDGMLTIKAERQTRAESDARSEFAYGSFVRTMALPAGYIEDDVKAAYDQGILTVTVPLAAATSPGKHIPVVVTESSQ
ncbi:Hsp20/alpha crystallin family protein [Williamsia sp. 1135]|uniref:Hsp20/alpha crystallin family protein n=1 Tax=Williamsia sp. 1135 TaxID=1889262 RepID=UPI000A100211|nr:Hsp20/alpha crystallin family protein [Williamsia sp. 1135]ORM36785.1 heat-shock protein Hsp20 [Williamsia sp. 1135]